MDQTETEDIKKRWQEYTEEGGNGLTAEPFQILQDDAVKVLPSICQLIWKTQQWPQDWKRSVFISIPKNAQTTTQLYSYHTLEK